MPAAYFGILSLVALHSACFAQIPTDPARYPKVRSIFDQPVTKPGIACTVKQLKPDLNFSFRFQAGYFASWPLKNYEGPGHSFAIVTRVTPLNPAGDPVYFSQVLQMRAIPSRSRNEIQVDGAYFFGEGEYAIDLIVVDKASRVCRKQWNIDVKSPGNTGQIKAAQAPGTVQPAVLDNWDGVLNGAGSVSGNVVSGEVAPGSVAPVKDNGPPRRLTVLMHVTPLNFRSNRLHAYDQAMLLSSLLALLTQTSFTEVKLVAFNLDQQMELFRQERFDAEGWSKLVPAIHNLQLGAVSYKVLQQRTGHVDLLAGLIDEELTADQPADVVLFLGPTARQEEKLRIPLTQGEANRPLFVYFEFKPYWWRGYEFPDILYHVTRSQAGKIFRIHSPIEFVRALQSMEKLAAERRHVAGIATRGTRMSKDAPALH